MKYCGYFILISKQRIDREEILPTYYIRQSIEQIFGFSKTNNMLPLRVHSDQSIKWLSFASFFINNSFHSY